MTALVTTAAGACNSWALLTTSKAAKTNNLYILISKLSVVESKEEFGI